MIIYFLTDSVTAYDVFNNSLSNHNQKIRVQKLRTLKINDEPK